MNNQRRVTVALLLGLVVATLLSPLLAGQGGSALAQPPFAYALTNDGGLRFLDEYQRLGGVATLGYPASNRFQLPDGFTYQLTQAALLQWRPDLDGVSLANTFEMLESAGKDDWLFAFRGIPRPVKDDGSGGDWQKAKQTRLNWLTNETIKAHFLANPNPAAIRRWSVDDSIQLYGLPMSQPERFGPFVCQRFQRVSLQLWVEQVEGMPAPGTVVRVLGGDLLKEAGLVPEEALEAGDRPTPTATATATPVPPTATRAPSRPRAPTATPTPFPTPPTGTFVGRWEFPETIYSGSPDYHVEGPFLNLAFGPGFVGRSLTVRRVLVTCRPPDTSCQTPRLYIYRSLVGAVDADHHYYDIPPWTSYGHPGDAVREAEDADGVLTWKIQGGQYFLFAPALVPSKFQNSGPVPLSITYSVSISN